MVIEGSMLTHAARARSRHCLAGTSKPLKIPPRPHPQRTNMRTTTVAAKLGHMPQEDYADALHEPLLAFLQGEEVTNAKVSF